MSLKDLQAIVDSGVKLTPMMDQYFQIKKNYPETLLLFRMGDFYEVFFEDAKTTSKILNITLTHRGKIGETPIPMAGIPHHAASSYIDRITNMGLKVAICEQVQDPKDAVGIVKRAVTQVVSPGMPFDLEKTTSNEHRYMISTYKSNDLFYLVALDFTTGDFKGFKLKSSEDFIDTIRNLAPKEFITYMGQWSNDKVENDLETILAHYGVLKTHLSEEYFVEKFSHLYIEKIIPGYKRDRILKLDENILNAIGALSYYVISTQSLESFIHIRPFKLIAEEEIMKVTLPTLAGLEILPKSKELYKESLLGFFDKTETAMGARNLKNVFSKPLKNKELINDRLNYTEALLNNLDFVKDLKTELSKIRDLERILAKITTNKCSSSDLLNISHAILATNEINLILKKFKFEKSLSPDLSNEEVKKLNELAAKIKNTLNDEIGASLEKGNLIRSGIHKERDRLAKLHLNVADELLKMENDLREKTGISKLKIKSNNISGFFIEVSKGSSIKIPKYFERRQTLVNAERFTTKELEQLEKDTITAQTKLEKLEKEIFKELILFVSDLSFSIQKLSDFISLIDVIQSFSILAHEENFSRPEIVDEKYLQIKQGFHPLIKSVIREQFVAHDLILDKNKYFGLITGPNMAGKTTVMREVAIIQFLSQIGSFVPATYAKLGLCDFLFSRLGASDDILKGQSTFMVEMAETAEILRHATDRSLIILDEVGRGTSTYDGLSIAWGLVEHFIQKTKAVTLFATHYHELIEVINNSKNAKNLTVETINHKGNVQFLYRLLEKPASQSFGIYVAKLAGLPSEILSRSEEILHKLESHQHPKIDNEINIETNQLSFFPEEKTVKIPPHLKALEEEISKIDIIKMTPLDALIKLNELKDRIDLH